MTKTKVFCIGANKTGTTSLEQALATMGYRMGDQAEAELLIEDWARRDFRRIAAFCCSADAFQDIPFSLPYTYQALDAAFPGSKFILSVRASADEWLQSMIRFHTKLLGLQAPPTERDLRNFPYRYPGWMWRVIELVYAPEPGHVYQVERFKEVYERHNRSAREYFKYRPRDFLELRIDQDDSILSLYEFLGLPYGGQRMPHLQASR